jgi:hypothetical protein
MSNKECTTDRAWCRDQSDRLLNWEIFRRSVMHETEVPMSTDDLYDKIGISKTYIRRLLQSIPEKLNEQ